MVMQTNSVRDAQDAQSAIRIGRRRLICTAAFIILGARGGLAEIIRGDLPFTPNQTNALTPDDYTGWQFLNRDEGRVVEAICDTLIPPDDAGPGGKDAGCAVFIDRQLAGGYGSASGDYVQPPFMPGAVTQGYQGSDTPAAIYRKGLIGLGKLVAAQHDGKGFADLAAEDQVKVLQSLEDGSATFDGEVSATLFFNTILTDTKTGYFADPIYGGNKDMAAWKMIGFPGARYDYRDWVSRHNEVYPLPPVGLTGRAEWNRKG
jgi:gluconate 2-dehydrogenase gamma chain